MARNEVAKFWSNLRLSQHTPCDKDDDDDRDEQGDWDAGDDDFDRDPDDALFFVIPFTNMVWQKCWTVSH